MARFYSTRDAHKKNYSFQEALLQGLAADGGLFVPNSIPSLDARTWLEASSIAELALPVMQAWLADEIASQTLASIMDEALNFKVPLVNIGNDIAILELIHGPTLSFKDFGARTMARLMAHFLAERQQQATILVATSGDTGSAVADGFAGHENINVVLLYPKGLVSDVQERQLVVKRDGVRSFAVEGSFDDCQRMVKEAFVDQTLSHLPLSSANSINIGRLLPQSLYYLWAANQLAKEAIFEVNVCVPSGNLGNLTAAYLAYRMGMKVKRFIAGHNANHFFPDYLKGRAKAFAFQPTVATLSNAMDVGAPSNFERLHHLLPLDHMQALIWGTGVSDEATFARMKATYSDSHYIACPHTAVGLEAVSRYRAETADNTPFISLACAHPAKFPTAVSKALAVDAPLEPRLEALKTQAQQVTVIPPTLEAMRDVLLVQPT
jgi:threonine synthase